MAKKKTESAVVVTRAEKKDATKKLIRELLSKEQYKHNDLIDEVAKSYAKRFEGEETENINDVKGRVGSVLDIMKKDGDVLLDGGMYALKQETPAPVAEEKPVKKTTKKAEPKKKATAKKEVEVKTGEMVSEKETPLQPQKKEEEKSVKKTATKRTKAAKKAEETEEKTAPLPTPPIQPIAPVAPITPEVAPEPIPESTPKKHTKKAKKETTEEVKTAEIANEPPMAEVKEEKPVEKQEKTPTMVEVKVEEVQQQALTVKEKGEITPKKDVVDMSFLFGNVKPKIEETKQEAKTEVKPIVKEEKPALEPERVEPKTEEKPIVKQEERKPERVNERKGKPVTKTAEQPRQNTPMQNNQQPAQSANKPLRVQSSALSVRHRSDNKPMTEEEKLRENFLRRLRALGGDYFEYYSVYLLEKYSRRNGRRLEGLRISGGEHDGGIDGEIELTDKFGFRETIYIQSKNWDPDKGDEKLWVVGETLLQQFIGACVCRQAKDGKQHTRGIFITTSRFTPEAKRLLDQMSDTIIGYDGAELFETAKECSFGLINKNGTWQLDEQLLSGTKAFFNML